MLDLTRAKLRVIDGLWWLSRRYSRLAGILLGYAIGVLATVLSDPNISSTVDFLRRVYGVRQRSIAWANVVVTALFVVSALARVFVPRYLRGKDYASQLSKIYADKLQDAIRPFHSGRIAWGGQLVLQSCPNLADGWTPAEVEIQKLPSVFSFPSSMQRPYRSWLTEQAEPAQRRGERFRLRKIPVAFTDDPGLILEVEVNSWSQVAYFRSNVAVLAEQRSACISQAVDRTTPRLGFPHSLCLHAVVATSDGYVLMTRRSPVVAYFPGTWSCSIEEQLGDVDFAGGRQNVMEAWARRMLREELGVFSFNTRNVRVFAVFLESDIVNCSLAGLVTLDCDRTELDAILSKHPRKDYEFSEWEFVRWEDLASELCNPSRDYHPSSGLRMFLAGIARYGDIGFGRMMRKTHVKTLPWWR